MVTVIIISPLTLAINRGKLGEEKGSEKLEGKRVKGVSIIWGVVLSLSAENNP